LAGVGADAADEVGSQLDPLTGGGGGGGAVGGGAGTANSDDDADHGGGGGAGGGSSVGAGATNVVFNGVVAANVVELDWDDAVNACGALATTTTTTLATTTTASVSPTTVVLARTGTDRTPTALVGLGLIATGAGIVVLAGRRLPRSAA
jgi:hypothetical protein